MILDIKSSPVRILSALLDKMLLRSACELAKEMIER